LPAMCDMVSDKNGNIFIGSFGDYDSGLGVITISDHSTSYMPLTGSSAWCLTLNSQGDILYSADGLHVLTRCQEPRIFGSNWRSDGFEFSILAPAGSNYRIQASSDLKCFRDICWEDIFQYQNRQEVTRFIDTDAVEMPQRFYRIVSP